MSDTDALRDIFLDVSEEGTVTESQRDGHSHDPIEGESSVPGLQGEDGLEDAVEGALDEATRQT